MSNEHRIYGFILALVRDWADADDLMQETTAVLWRKFDTFEEGTNFVAWALKTARFQVMNHQKQRRVRRARLSDRNLEAIADRLASAQDRPGPRREALDGCLNQLSEHERELIRLRYEPGLTTNDVADQVGRSIHAVYKALNRIHARLLECVRRTLAIEGAS